MDGLARIRQLEWRLERSWLFSPNFFTRFLVVIGYWWIGYLMMVCVIAAIAILFAILTPMIG